MHAELASDPRAFVRLALQALAADELRATVPLSVLATLDERVVPGGPPIELWTTGDAQGAALFALRTPPYSLTLAPVPGRAEADVIRAVAAFAAARARVDDGVLTRLTRVAGPRDVARVFLEAFGRPTQAVRTLRLYRLDRVRWPARPAPGHFRPAAPADHAELVAFFEAFVRDVDGASPDADKAVAGATTAGRLFVWEDDGRVVSMAQRSVRTGRSARVNLVYTPDALRGRGYASATVAALSQRVLDEAPARDGFVCLFTNLANPTSNAIYQALGYAPVEDFLEAELA